MICDLSYKIIVNIVVQTHNRKLEAINILKLVIEVNQVVSLELGD